MQERAQTISPCSSSNIALFGMRTVQAEGCLNFKQIDTLFISVKGQEGGLGGGGHFGPETQNLHVTVMNFFVPSWGAAHYLKFLFFRGGGADENVRSKGSLRVSKMSVCLRCGNRKKNQLESSSCVYNGMSPEPNEK